MTEFYVEGSDGYLVCDTVTGEVIDCHLYTDFDGESNYPLIKRIDLAGNCFKGGDSWGILDVGYWMQDGTYEPAIKEEETPDPQPWEHLFKCPMDDPYYFTNEIEPNTGDN